MSVTYTDYLENDHHIFPLHPIVNGVCGCEHGAECKAVGKHPIMSNWQYVTTWDDEQLATLEDADGIWGGNRFESGFGVNLQGRHLLVVDIDARNGGVESAAQFAGILSACTFVVKTGSGGGSKHYYFNIPEAWRGKALRSHLDTAKGIDFKSTGFVVGAGSMHKSGNRYEAIIGDPGDIGDAPEALLQMLLIPEKQRTMFEGKTLEYTDQELHDIVMAINNDAPDYEKWIRVGMGVHHATGGNGYDLWVKWSAKCKQAHDETDMPMKWGSFGRSANSVTIGTLLTWAKQDGYDSPVEFTDDTEWEPIDVPQDQPEEPVGINLMRPPGLVGKITAWINSRSIYPREHLAVAAALQIVSNIASLRYRVAPLDTSLNMITFGVAGSGSGKGAILKCINEVMRKVGIEDANYGGIKSEQEILRNAMRHQATFFTIDEVGAFLSKIGGAKKSGGKTPYLENVSTKIMELYSASNEVYSISGDLKRELREAIDKDIARVNKQMEKEGETPELQKDLESLLKQRQASKSGIAYPIMAFFGISEPDMFNEATNDRNLITGGFLGRALIFEEIDSVPLRKPLSEISKAELPPDITMHLSNMYWNGHATISNDARVEQHGDTAIITTTEAAEAELDRVYMYWHKRGKKEQDDGSGLSSLTNRATELTIKVAGILAAESLVMTVEHVRWAYALVKKVTDMKISKAKALQGSESADAVEKGDGLIEAIRSVLMVGDYHTVGVIANRFRSKYKKADIENALKEMVARGIVKRMEVKDACNRTQVRYSMDK